MVSCLTAAIMDGQVLNILIMLASAHPNHTINKIGMRNQLAQNKWTNFISMNFIDMLQFEHCEIRIP